MSIKAGIFFFSCHRNNTEILYTMIFNIAHLIIYKRLFWGLSILDALLPLQWIEQSIMKFQKPPLVVPEALFNGVYTIKFQWAMARLSMPRLINFHCACDSPGIYFEFPLYFGIYMFEEISSPVNNANFHLHSSKFIGYM